jgi:RNA polymerase sigma-70 factor (ECF subfamily)
VARTDEVLLRELTGGDLAALGELYDRHAAAMWRAVERTLGRRDDAGDVVHTVFLMLPKIARSYDGRKDARAWLVGIAVRVSLRQRRSVRRFLNMLTSLSQCVPPFAGGDPEARTSGREKLGSFGDALRRLSTKKRAVFALVELEGMTTDEAANALGIPAATARTRLHHARRELSEAMKRRGDA